MLERSATSLGPWFAQVRDYLALGFIADAAQASDYLVSLTRNAITPCEPAFSHLLPRIIESRLRPSDTSAAIPLTAGNDSRAILGAALEVFSSEKITCLTYGSKEAPDRSAASALCKRLGIRHIAVDPSQFVWDFDEIVDLARKHHALTGKMVEIDGLLMFKRLADTISDDTPVLSGFLGDTLTGKSVPLEEYKRSTPDGATEHFLLWHRALLGDREDARLRIVFTDFIREHGELFSRFAGITDYDILNLGFRQPQRTKLTVTGAFKRCITPFEDERWVGYWLSRPIAERLAQRAYIDGLRSSFPHIFPTPDPPGRLRSMYRNAVPQRLRLAIRAIRHGNFAPAAIPDFVDLGDPRRDENRRRFLHHCVARFDARRIDGAVSARDALRRLLKSPSKADRYIVACAVDAEVYAAAASHPG